MPILPCTITARVVRPRTGAEGNGLRGNVEGGAEERDAPVSYETTARVMGIQEHKGCPGGDRCGGSCRSHPIPRILGCLSCSQHPFQLCSSYPHPPVRSQQGRTLPALLTSFHLHFQSSTPSLLFPTPSPWPTRASRSCPASRPPPTAWPPSWRPPAWPCCRTAAPRTWWAPCCRTAPGATAGRPSRRSTTTRRRSRSETACRGG